MFTREMRGQELATYLSENLTDSEFELLLRYRCQKYAKQLNERDYADSHTHFYFSWRPQGRDNGWTAHVGINYSKCSKSEGEVLARCVENAVTLMELQQANKISGLLTSGDTNASTADPF